MKEKEKLDPNLNPVSRSLFLSNFDWSKSILTKNQRQKVEELLIQFHDVFARHRLDIGGNDSFKIKLTPEHDRAMYTQSPPTPIHLRDDILVELALLQYYGIITTLPYSKYSSPIFAQRKPSGALRLLIDLRRVNHLIRHDYDSHNFPITTLADASSHLAGKNFLQSWIAAKHIMF